MQTNVKSSVKISRKSVVKFCKVFLKSYFLWKRFRRSPPCLAGARQGGGGVGASRFENIGKSVRKLHVGVATRAKITRSLASSRLRVKGRERGNNTLGEESAKLVLQFAELTKDFAQNPHAALHRAGCVCREEREGTTLWD